MRDAMLYDGRQRFGGPGRSSTSYHSKGVRRGPLGISLLGIALVAGCTTTSRQPQTQPTTSSVAIPTSLNTVEPTTTTSPLPTAQEACAAHNLILHLLTTGAAAGNYIMVFEFTNIGSTPCSVTGYPGVSVLDAKGRIVQHPASRSPGPGTSQILPVTTVTLTNGGHAQFLLASVDTVPNPDCASQYQGTTLRVYPPGSTVAIEEPFAMGFCDLAVGPVHLG